MSKLLKCALIFTAVNIVLLLSLIHTQWEHIGLLKAQNDLLKDAVLAVDKAHKARAEQCR
jgi:hypothetical protein